MSINTMLAVACDRCGQTDDVPFVLEGANESEKAPIRLFDDDVKNPAKSAAIRDVVEALGWDVVAASHVCPGCQRGGDTRRCV